MKALSIRQPWAWLIVNGYKTVENRSRSLGKHCGPLLIHASSQMTHADYVAAYKHIAGQPALRNLLADLPPISSPKFEFGGIVGTANMSMKLENINAHEARAVFVNAKFVDWYTGPVGYVLKDAKPLPFKECKGRLGFFDVDYEALP
jgi:ASCH domain